MKLSKRERACLEARVAHGKAQEVYDKIWVALSERQIDKLNGLLYYYDWDAAAIIAAADKDRKSGGAK